MPLSNGEKLGPYEIRALIGKGGMGEVYRAHDDRLRRDVAIKVSKDQFTERFTREARTIASLNHTNICHLYDVGPNYLVMEYVEGADLKGPLDFDDALPIIQQIIDGIEAAHEKNIIHRDLKPANIKITPDGVVKILDFGLAKAMEPPPDSDPENSPTLTMGGTVEGTILGTAAYMSPEQAKGKAADKRSDIWSFGAVVYEMLTGKRLFHGESVVEILGSVLNKEPDLSAAPPRVHKLLQWCLEKDRKQRLQSIGDARRMLREPAAESAPATVHPSRKWLWPLIAVALLVTAVAGWLRNAPVETASAPSLVLTIVPPADTPLAEIGSPTAMPVISPDGSAVLYGAKGGLYVRRLDSLNATLVPGSEQAAGVPFWSHDSASVYFPTVREELIRVRLPDGAPDVVTALPGFTMSGSENAAGDVVISSLERLHLSTPAERKLRRLDLDQPGKLDGQRFPEFLPGGDHLLYAQFEGDVMLASFENGKATRSTSLTKSGTQASYTPAGGGRILFLRNDSLYSQKLDLDQRKLTGESQLVQEGISSIPGLPGNRAYFTVSRSGSVAWRPGRAALHQVVTFDRTGKALGTTGPPLLAAMLSLSPDGTRLLAAAAASPSVLLDIGQPASQDLGEEWRYWSPDGTGMIGKRGGKVIAHPVVGGQTTEIADHDEVQDGLILDVSPDGTQLLYSARGSTDLMVRQISGPPEKRAPRLLATANKAIGPVENAKFSPDGRWIVYRQGGLFLQPFPGPGLRRQIAEEGDWARWRADGKEIFYFAGGGIRSLPVDLTGPEPRLGTPTQLFSGQLRIPPGRANVSFPWALSRDGSRIYWLQGAEQPGSDVIQVRTNAVK